MLHNFCKNQNLPRESLYKSFRNDGDPKISTIMRVLNGLNCTLNIVPLEKQVSKQPSNYSLGDNHPFVLPFWDYDNNKSISPYRITSKSRRPINWKCTSHEPIYKWKENPVSLIRRFTSKISKNLEWIKINKDAVEYVCPLCSKC